MRADNEQKIVHFIQMQIVLTLSLDTVFCDWLMSLLYMKKYV